MLDGFQKNLCSISSEIQQLQQQSVAMNVKLKNRQAVRSELSQFIDEMVVPEAMIKYTYSLYFKIDPQVNCILFKHNNGKPSF